MAARLNPGRTMSEEQREAMFALEQKVLEYRTSGMSFPKINKACGIGNSHQVFQRAMARDANIEFKRAEALRMEEARLDALQEGIWGSALAGNARAVEVALKVLERRARLLGLDFADMISSKLVEVEQAKVALIATAMAEALADAGVDATQRERAMATLWARLRSGTTEPLEVPDDLSGEGTVLIGTLVVSAADRDLL